MSKKLRFIYATAFAVLLFTEIMIALFVHDGFIRPYMGDVLVTILICCLCKAVVPKGVPFLPIYVFVFAAFVEAMQYFQLVKLVGLENNTFISTVVGTTFSFFDLICYGIGCLVFWVTEKAVYSVFRHQNGS